MELVHEAHAKQSAVAFATAFAKQSFDFPLPTKPLKGRAKINFVSAAEFHGVGDSAEPSQFAVGRPPAGEDDDGRKPVTKNRGAGIEGAGATDDDPDIVLGQAVLEAQTAKSRRARAEVDLFPTHGARAGHHRVRGGAQLKQVLEVAPAA